VTKDFEGLVAVVTGGASGIGAAIATRLRTGGARIAVFDVQPRGTNTHDLVISVNIADDDSVRAGIDRVAAEFGGIDIVVNNAGIGAIGTVETNSDDEWHRILDVNVIGTARVSRAALPHLRRSPVAAIVNVSSVAATAGVTDRALYSASKGAISALTRAMAADHLHEGVRVNAVTPGTADTPWVQRLLSVASNPTSERSALEARQPHGRLVDPQEIADAVAYLASPTSRSTTGISLAIDGGMQELRVRPRG